MVGVVKVQIFVIKEIELVKNSYYKEKNNIDQDLMEFNLLRSILGFKILIVKAQLIRLIPSPFNELAYSEDQDFMRQISSDHDSQDSLIQENANALRRDSIQDMFKDYEYNDHGMTGSTYSTQIL